MIRKLLDGIAAGILISIGGCVFLSCCGAEMKWLGAILFSVALLCICYKGYALFTGKVGYLVNDHSRDSLCTVLLALVGNAISCCGIGLLISAVMPGLGDTAYAICSAKLEQVLLDTVVRSMLCGVLMYMAVSIYKEKNTPVGILFCVPVFILAGFEHSIANMFYFGAAKLLNVRAALYLCVVVLGNSAGGMLFPALDSTGKSKEAGHV